MAPKRNMKTVTLTNDECRRLNQKPGTKAQIEKSSRPGWANGVDVYVGNEYAGTIVREQ